MSQTNTRGNPSFGKKANVPTPTVKISNSATYVYAPVPYIPNSTTLPAPTPMSSNPVATLPIAPAIVAIPRSSNLIVAPMEVAKKEDFGRDKDLNTLLKHLQPKAFKEEGTDTPKILEEWIISMDDYFALANYNSIAQGIMGKA